MKNFLIAMGTRSAILRLTPLVLPAILAAGIMTGCGPQPGQAPYPGGGPQSTQTSLVGQWRTVLQGANVTITIEANGQYMQVGVPLNGGTQMAQGGPYQLVAPNTIIFTVTDWSPKTKIALVPCGIPSEPVCNVQQVQNVPQPPGSRYAYTFNGPNTLILNNEQAQETITFVRVTAQ